MKNTCRNEVLAGRGVLPLIGASRDRRRRDPRIDEPVARNRAPAVPNAVQILEQPCCSGPSADNCNVQGGNPAQDLRARLSDGVAERGLRCVADNSDTLSALVLPSGCRSRPREGERQRACERRKACMPRYLPQSRCHLAANDGPWGPSKAVSVPRLDCDTLLRGMARTGYAGEEGRLQARVDVHGSGIANVDTGIPVLDHLLSLLAEHASFDLALEIAPEEPDAEVAAAGRALGQALSDALHADGVRGHGSAVVPADEALAHVALEVSGRPLLVSNVDLSDMGVGGLATDLVARFLTELTEGAGLTLHVRLIEGRDTQHVLEAIFKGLGVALAQSCRPRRGKEIDGD
jgi:imidazoleglycerol-phosphate dehydratase